MENFEQIKIGCSAALWEWLDENDGQAESVWLVTFKRPQGRDMCPARRFWML